MYVLKFFPILITIFFVISLIIFDQSIPQDVKSFALGISMSLKNILMSFIPFVIFSSVYKAFSEIMKETFRYMVVILVAIVGSNFASVIISGTVSYVFFGR